MAAPVVLRHRVVPERGLSVSIHEVLDPEEDITPRLEDAAQLKGPGYLGRRGEEPEHLHGVTHEPRDQDRRPEALARPRLRIDVYLREGEGRFDGEANVAEHRGVYAIQRAHWREDELAYGEGDEEVEEELPVSMNVTPELGPERIIIARGEDSNSRFRRPPLPEVVGPLRRPRRILGASERGRGLASPRRR